MGAPSLEFDSTFEGLRESYVKIPEDVIRVIATAQNQGQQDRLFGAYCRYFINGNPGAVPKSILPSFALICGPADRIKAGIATGGKRRGQTHVKTTITDVEKRREPREKSVTSLEEVSEKSGSSLEIVCKHSKSSQNEDVQLPAEMSPTPPRLPRTQYKDKNKYSIQRQRVTATIQNPRQEESLAKIAALTDEEREEFGAFCDVFAKLESQKATPDELTDEERSTYTEHAREWYPLYLAANAEKEVDKPNS